MKKWILVILVIVTAAGVSSGNIYFWTDSKGVRHYSNVSAPANVNVQELEEANAVYQKLNQTSPQSQTFKVLKVYDGDSLQVEGLGLVFKIRLAGIDAPEIGYKGQPSQPYSQKSKQYLEQWVGQKVIRLKSHGIGGYNRQLAEVFINGTNVNLEMIKAGLAEVYQGRKPRSLDSETYLAEETKARTAGRGAWSLKAGYQSPRAWRKAHPRK